MTDTQMLSKNLITGAKSYLDWFIMGLSRHLNGGNLIRQFSGVEDVASMDLKDKQCRIQVELHDGSLYTDLQRSKTENPLFWRLLKNWLQLMRNRLKPTW